MALVAFGLGGLSLLLPSFVATPLQYVSVGLSIVAIALVYSGERTEDPFRKRRGSSQRR